MTEQRKNNPETEFLDYVKGNFSRHSFEMITGALNLAREKMAGMERYNGKQFIEHDIQTALIVARDIGLGRNSVVSTLLHDAARLKLIDLAAITKEYGFECEKILRALCNISEVDPKVSNMQIDNFRELIISYSSDPRVILIKIADRLEVMRSLGDFPEQKQIKKSWESINIYSQIAHKLGLFSIKSELEDLSLKYLEPKDYAEISAKLSESEQERETFIEAFIRPIKTKLAELGIAFNIKSRTKSVYSIWRKMHKQNIPFEEVFDLFAIRIIIDAAPEREKAECWQAYSVVTDFYTPNPDRMRDWISIPKSNGYESLHATVVTKQGRWVEVQIRSERMDEVAEKGVAAHWRYKGVKQGAISGEEWLLKIRELMSDQDAQGSLADNQDLLSISSKEVFVFTPNGDLRRLTEGATVLDFAYDIHSNIGTRCVGARVNNKNVSIREVLHNGDLVEILTSKNQKPKADWLNIVATSKARTRIKVFLREEQAKEANLGREELERKMKNWKTAMPIDDAVTALCKHYKVKTGTELYALIASQRISMGEIKEVLTSAADREREPEIQKSPAAAAKKPKEGSADTFVIDEQLNGINYHLARCCNPIYGDQVVGFVTISKGITVHRTDCPNCQWLSQKYDYRIIPVQWKGNAAAAGSFIASIKIHASDESGIINRITEIITKDLKINIRSMNLSTVRGGMEGVINIEVSGTPIVDLVVHSLMRMKAVDKAYRLNK